MRAPERRKILEKSVSELAKRISSYRPEVIVIILKRIDQYARKAIEQSNISCPRYTISFPVRFKKGCKDFKKILTKHL